MLIVAIIGIIMCALVTYALYKPYKTYWSTDIYETPQSFTDVGLEAEWEIPRLPEEVPPPPTAEAPVTILAEPPKKPRGKQLLTVPGEVKRKRKSTIMGAVPPFVPQTVGVKALNRSEVAKAIHANLCKKGCDSITHSMGKWSCKCGQVTMYANLAKGVQTMLSVQK